MVSLAVYVLINVTQHYIIIPLEKRGEVSIIALYILQMQIPRDLSEEKNQWWPVTPEDLIFFLFLFMRLHKVFSSLRFFSCPYLFSKLRSCVLACCKTG
jgi:hypothetical protein